MMMMMMINNIPSTFHYLSLHVHQTTYAKVESTLEHLITKKNCSYASGRSCVVVRLGVSCTRHDTTKKLCYTSTAHGHSLTLRYYVN